MFVIETPQDDSRGSRRRYTTGTNGPQTGGWRIGNILVPQGPNTLPRVNQQFREGVYPCATYGP